MAWVWPLFPDRPLPDVGELTDQVSSAFTLGHERTTAQDVSFGFRQLVDVASRALSPRVNDPTTAVPVIGHLDHLLCPLARRQMGDEMHHDDEGRLLLVVRRMSFAEMLDLACGQIRRYGASEPDVVVEMLLDVGGCCRCEADRQSVRDQIDRLVAAARRGFDEPADLVRVLEAAVRVPSATRRTWRPGATAASTAVD